MKTEQLQSLAASFQAAHKKTDGDRLQVWVTADEAGEVVAALKARIDGAQVLGMLPAGVTVLSLTPFDGGLVLATNRGVYRLNQQHKFEPIELGDKRSPVMVCGEWVHP